MKNLLKYLFACFLVIFLAVHCKQNTSQVRTGKADTSFCIGIYKNILDSTVRYGEMRRIVKDTFQWVVKDSVTRTMEWVRDSFYIIILQTKIPDSTTAKAWGVPFKDSTGKINYAPLWYWYDKKFVRSGWDRSDSAIAQLQRIKI